MNPSEYFHRNFVITGIPRSGTSLMSKLVNLFDNAVCLNEIFYNVGLLPGWFADIRTAIVEGKPIPNRYDNQGELTSNTMKDGEELQYKKFDRKFSEDILIGSKVNAPYMFQLDKIIYNRIPVIAIIRHPVYVIGSYQMPWTATLNIANPLTDKRYKDYPFRNSFAKNWPYTKGKKQLREDLERKAKINCQAELWEYFAKVLLQYEKDVHIFKYEEITDAVFTSLEKFAGLFDLSLPQEIPMLENKNDDSRYKHLQDINDAVKLWCPSIERFGYSL